MATTTKRHGTLAMLALIALAAGTAALGGCGGGGSSGGAGGGTTPLAGTYSGNLTMTLAGNGLPTVTDSDPATLQITNEGGVFLSVRDDDGQLYGDQGVLSGNRFTLTDGSESTQNGVTCAGTVTISGTVTGNDVSGRISGSITCNGMPITVSGSLALSKSPTAALGVPMPAGATGLLRAVVGKLRQ